MEIKLIGKYGTEEQIEEILKMSELDDNKIDMIQLKQKIWED